MARTRALLTDTEREQLANGDEQKRYQVASRVRSRIQDELTTDVGVLEQHHDTLLQELKEVVCD